MIGALLALSATEELGETLARHPSPLAQQRGAQILRDAGTIERAIGRIVALSSDEGLASLVAKIRNFAGARVLDSVTTRRHTLVGPDRLQNVDSRR